jgi:hypothetical protein
MARASRTAFGSGHWSQITRRDIDADCAGEEFLRHGVLLVLAPLASLSLAGQEHGRTIPLVEMRDRDNAPVPA